MVLQWLFGLNVFVCAWICILVTYHFIFAWFWISIMLLCYHFLLRKWWSILLCITLSPFCREKKEVAYLKPSPNQISQHSWITIQTIIFDDYLICRLYYVESRCLHNLLFIIWHSKNLIHLQRKITFDLLY